MGVSFLVVVVFFVFMVWFGGLVVVVLMDIKVARGMISFQAAYKVEKFGD